MKSIIVNKKRVLSQNYVLYSPVVSLATTPFIALPWTEAISTLLMLIDRWKEDNRSGVLRYSDDVLLECCPCCILVGSVATDRFMGALSAGVLPVLLRIGDSDPKLSFFVSLSSKWLSVGDPK